MIDRTKCEGCPLHDHEPVEDITKGDNPAYIVVTEAPAAYNAQRGRLLSNNASTVLSRELGALGFSSQDFVFVPQIRCVFDADTLPNKTKSLIQKQCRTHFLDAVRHYKPDVILPLGAEPCKQVQGRAVKITKVRGIAEFNEEHQAVVIPMLHPGYVAMYPQHASVFTADCNTFARVVDTGLDIEAASTIDAEGYHIIDDLQFLIDLRPPLIFFDTETTGLEFFHKGPDNVRDYRPDIHGREFNPSAAILTMQFCVEPGTAYMLVWDHPEKPISLRNKAKIKRQLVQLFGRKKTRVIGQNSKFDSNFVFETLGIRYEIGGDTLMLAALLDENMISKGQDVLVKHYVAEKAGYADTFNAAYNKSRMWEVPLDALLVYGCGDVDTGLMLYKVLIKKLLEDTLLTAQYRYVSLPGINTFADIEVNGIEVDDEALQAFQEIMEESVEQQYQSLIAQVPRSIRRKHIDKGLKFSRAALLLDILFYHRDGFRLRPQVFTKSTEKLQADMRVPSVSTKDHLPYFYDDCPFTEELATYIKDERLLNTSVKGFRNKYIHDGLVRSVYSLWTTVTGRSSSENPNCFPGYVEVLTARGWVRFDEARQDDSVAQYNLYTGEIDFAAPLDFLCYAFSGELLHIKTQQQIDIVSTKDHRYPLINRKTWVYGEHTAATYPKDALQLHAGLFVGGSVSLSPDQVALIAAIQADAHINACEGVEWVFSKDRKVARLLWALDTNNIPYRVSYKGAGTTRVYVSGKYVPDWLYDKKYFGTWLLGLDRSSFVLLAHELHFWDGDYTRRSTWTSSIKSNADWAQILFTLAGTRAWTRETCNTTCHSFHIVNTSEGRTFSSTTNHTKTLVPYKGDVYCYTMPQDTLIVRHNGRVHIVNNSQNFPKRGPNAKAYRRIFIAPRGWVVIEADLSQAELRIAADMANEQTMLRIYREGGDIHKSTALIVMGVSLEEFLTLPKDEQKAARQKAKAVNFGFVYGMGWRKFIGYAKTQYGVEFSEQEAQRIREAFFSLYSGLARWHETMRAWAREHGYVRSYSGRIRHLPMIYSDDEGVQQEAGRQAVNSPVQNFASDLGVIAISRMRNDIDPVYLKPIAFVHDAIYCYAREEYAMWGAETIKYYMESNPLVAMFRRRMKVPIIADVSVGRNFGDTYELEGFTSAEEFDVGSLWNEDEKSGILLPKQRRPYKNGVRQQPLYCTAT